MAKAKASKKSSKKKKGKTSKKTTGAVPKSLRKGALPSSLDDVLAAGLGALRDAQSSGGKRFDELVKRGKDVQASGSDAVREASERVEQAVDQAVTGVRSAGDAVVGGVQDRVESVVEGVLSRLGVPTRDEVRQLQKTIEALDARVMDEFEVAESGSETESDSGAEERAVFDVRREDSEWAVVREGESSPSLTRRTKKEALHDARALARQHVPSLLRVYKLDGSVSETTEYDA